MNSLPCAHALAFAQAGFPVFPANPAPKPSPFSKAPLLPGESAKGARDGGHWLASADPGIVSGWWQRWPRALIGFPTGLRTACVVVDLDPKDVPTRAMLAALTAWCGQLWQHDAETGEVLETPIARTQSGGLHLYFAWPEEAVFAEVARNLTRLGKPVTGLIGNKADLFSRFLQAGECPAELAHIDVRGEGGYVIAPPSVMADGRAYEWIIPRGERLPALPRRLRGVITGEFIPEKERRERQQAARRIQGGFKVDGVNDRRVAAYIARAIDGALADARSAGEGRRNEAVFRAAVSLSRFTRSGHLGLGEAESLLLANLPAGVSPGEAKIRGTIASGLGADRVPPFTPDQLGPSQGRGM